MIMNNGSIPLRKSPVRLSLGWDVGEDDDAFPQWSVCRNKEVAERPCQAPNGSAPMFMGPIERMSLVTNARFAQWNGRGRGEDRGDRSAVERSNTVRWSRRFQGNHFRCRESREYAGQDCITQN